MICDGAGMDYHCAVASCTKSETIATVIKKIPNTAEPNICTTIFQALPKTGKMDEIIDKCTQLGVSRIVPVITARCVAKPSDRDAKKIDRWQKIALAAASQSQRGKVPIIDKALSFSEALIQAKSYDTTFACYEGEKHLLLRSYLQYATRIAFFVGPEGGFSNDEIAMFNTNGIATVSLGPRILRTELAGAVVLANLLEVL